MSACVLQNCFILKSDGYLISPSLSQGMSMFDTCHLLLTSTNGRRPAESSHQLDNRTTEAKCKSVTIFSNNICLLFLERVFGIDYQRTHDSIEKKRV